MIWKSPLESQQPYLGPFFDENEVVGYQFNIYWVPCQSKKWIIPGDFRHFLTNTVHFCGRQTLCDLELPSWVLTKNLFRNV